jgi:sulfur-carrier protein
MKIDLHLFASLASLTPSGVCEVPDGTTVEKLVAGLGIPPDLPRIIFLNGRHAKGAEVLRENDRVAVFPPIAGG